MIDIISIFIYQRKVIITCLNKNLLINMHWLFFPYPLLQTIPLDDRLFGSEHGRKDISPWYDACCKSVLKPTYKWTTCEKKKKIQTLNNCVLKHTVYRDSVVRTIPVSQFNYRSNETKVCVNGSVRMFTLETITHWKLIKMKSKKIKIIRRRVDYF